MLDNYLGLVSLIIKFVMQHFNDWGILDEEVIDVVVIDDVAPASD